MVTTTDEFIVTESVLMFVSSKPVTSIWYRQRQGVGSTVYLCWAYMHWWSGDGQIYSHIL
jgi:hypothetical protein